MVDLVLRAKATHLRAREVGFIVEDDGMKMPKAAYDILPEEFDNLLPCDIRERYHFYLFCEVVYDD